MPILNDVISISHYGLDTPKYLEVILKNISNETFTIGTHWCIIATPSPNNKNGPLKVLYSFSGSTEEEKKDSIRVLKVYTFPAQEVRPRGQMICVEFFVVHKCSDQLNFTIHKFMSCNVQNVFLCLTFPPRDGTVMTLARQLHSGRQLHKLMTKSASEFWLWTLNLRLLI